VKSVSQLETENAARRTTLHSVGSTATTPSPNGRGVERGRTRFIMNDARRNLFHYN